jgi:hypothetical protein
MSHIATYASSLGKVEAELFLTAVKTAADEFGGIFSPTVDSIDEGNCVASWRGHRLLGAIRLQDGGLPQGLGVYLDDRTGRPVFVADKKWVAEATCGVGHTWDQRFAPLTRRSEAAMTRLQQGIEGTYMALAVAGALVEMNFAAGVDMTENGQVVLTGTRNRVTA